MGVTRTLGDVLDRGFPSLQVRTTRNISRFMKRLISRGILGLSLLAASCAPSSNLPSNEEVAPVLETYANILHATYADAAEGAQALDGAARALTATPTEANLADARRAWIASRPAYLQSEVGRYYGGPIDDPDHGLEGQLNGWPLDEAYLDYVQGPPPDFADLEGGLVNEPSLLPTIDAEAVAAKNEVGAEENLSVGYHAIEFLLWGQDLYDDGPGRRPASDFVDGMRDNADRRRAYLTTITGLLADDLETLELARREGADDYRADFVALDAALPDWRLPDAPRQWALTGPCTHRPSSHGSREYLKSITARSGLG